MSKSISELRKKMSGVSELVEQVEKLAKKQTKTVDERFWKPTIDKSGNGFAIIRFLPAPQGEEVPWVRIFSHFFKGENGKWYTENSLTTLGLEDPVYESNGALYATKNEANKTLAGKRKRNVNFYANILVVSDSGNPENNGKVFLFKFGKSIFNMLSDQMTPMTEDDVTGEMIPDPDRVGYNPFSPWEGANFKFKIKTVAKFLNYDKSTFEEPSAISEDDEEIDKIWKQEYSLQEFLDPKNFKSYDELKKKFELVIGANSAPSKTSRVTDDFDEDLIASAPSKMDSEATYSTGPEDEIDLDPESYFKNLSK